MSDVVIRSIALVNFGTHAERTWTPGSGRLRAVVGPNGAGKSTLLVDAPMFCLFGSVPDGASADELVRIGATDMSVTVELDLGGQRHRAIRRRTTRAGGKSSADLQVQRPDGTWAPAASGADAVTAEVERLLRMDEHTFRVAVIIAQGDAQRFVEATPGKGKPTAPGRAAILSSLVVDPRFALIESSFRDEARALEARTVAERSQVERLDDAIEELALAPAAVVEHEAAVAAADHVVADGKARHRAMTARLTELAGEIAKGDVAAAEVARLEAERTALADRYRREKAAVTAGGEALARATAVVEGAGVVEAAHASLAGARTDVAALEAAETRFRALVDETRAQRDKVIGLEREWERLYEPWRARYLAAQARVAELIERGKAGMSTCETCGQAIGQVQALEQLAAARASVGEIEAAEPKPPLSIARESATHERLETRLREATEPDARALSAARIHLGELERTAARAGEIAAARDAIIAATAAKSSAEAELASITKIGADVAERIATATAATTAGAALLEEQATLRREVASVDEAIERAERQVRQAEAALATARAQVERREQLAAEALALRTGVAAADLSLGRLRRAIGDAGVRGIPARVVESVLPELIAGANELLGELRPGMTLDLRAQRAKADGKGTIEALDIWIRDWRGERQRWSGGEGTSIAMSIAVALSRLGARRSGASVGFQVIDEPDGLDRDSRRAFGQALQHRAHRGELEWIAVITHQDGIPDFADAVDEIEPAEPATDAADAAA